MLRTKNPISAKGIGLTLMLVSQMAVGAIDVKKQIDGEPNKEVFKGMIAAKKLKAECVLEVVAGNPNGPMTYDTKEIVIKKDCKKFGIRLVNKNIPSLVKQAMGHNIVIAPADKMGQIITAGGAAGFGKQYLPNKEKTGYLYATALLGPGEFHELLIDTAELKGNMAFVCTFAGHSAMMKGTIKMQ